MLHMPFNQEQQKQMQAEQEQIKQNIKHIKHQILVLSGKGGVGKSTIAVNLAVWLSLRNRKVGLLDIDIHGPSIPKLLNLDAKSIYLSHDKIVPAEYNENLKVMSIGLLMPSENQAVIWRGPMKHNLIRQFASQLEWGSLDFLVVDCPPGTGDEPLSIVQLLQGNRPPGETRTDDTNFSCSAVIVTTAQQLAVIDVKKCINFCKQLKLPVLGIIENMSGFVCPHCGEMTDIFKSGGGEKMAEQMNVPFLGRIPIDPQIVQACDSGRPFVYHYNQTETAKAFEKVLNPVLELDSKSQKIIETQSLHRGDRKMRIAIPLVQGKLSLHFGHCDQFAIFDIDDNLKKVINRKDATPPGHEPGVLPRWLHENNVSVIIAGGMGQRAQQLFTQNDIKVVVGASSGTPEELVSAFLQDTLETGDNICDH